MIQQMQYTATPPKYNFPHPTMDTALPQRLTQISLQSLKPNLQSSLQLNSQDNGTDLQLRLTPITLKPDHTETLVAAVDTSSMKIAETETGIIIAIRGATVWKQNHNYKYVRLGPFLFHITEDNKNQVYHTLQHAYTDASSESAYHNSPSLQQMPTRIANILERWLQNTLTRTINNALILIDGSLTAGTPDTPTRQLKETLQNARAMQNTVLAFSKMTTLRVNGHLITDLFQHTKPPCLYETLYTKPKPPFILLGDVYVAKLTSGNCAFRLDIDKEIPQQNKTEATERLLGNDIFNQSYPETLRLAHILCTFTANEVIAMKHYTTRNYGLRLVNRPDMHRLLFGLYGKGEAYA